MSSMADPSENHHHESLNELMAPAKRGSVGALLTSGSIIRGPSITPSGPFVPDMAPINFAYSMFSLAALSSSSTSCSGPPSSIPYSLVSPLGGTFAEVTGPFFTYPRAGHCEVYTLTTGNMNCFRDPTSPFKWFGFRNGNLKVEHFDRNFQFPRDPAGMNAREIMALHKVLLDALYTNYLDRHTTLSIDTALRHIQPEINRHLSNATLATVHIIYDFPFLERHIRDGKEVDVKVIVTIEFYQAPWRTGTRRWNRGGSLNCMSVNYHKTDVKVQHNFEEPVALDPLTDYPAQSQVDFITSSHAPIQPAALPTVAAVNPGAQMTTTAITQALLNAASQDSQAISSFVSGFDLDAGDVSMTNRNMFSNNAGIDLSQRPPSDTDTSLELGLSDNQLHFNPSSFQGPLDMLQGPPTPSSFQQVAQSSFVNDSYLFQDDDALVVNLDAHQPATEPISAIPGYSSPVRTTSSKPSSTSNPRRERTSNPSTRTTMSRQTGSTNPRSSSPTSPTPMSPTQTSTTKSVKSFPCRYTDCTHKPFATKWSMEIHANTHVGVRFPCPDCEKDYARPPDLTRHIQTKHLGILYKCDHCQAERSRNPPDSQLDGCDSSGRKHRYQRLVLLSAPTSDFFTADVL
ncbi:hypothetical protein BKA57DRAFT_460251 [Linnemannia elongata]|nr:hypothetical protein BKA57DRAFT_460251 [Linnemannia elongata]